MIPFLLCGVLFLHENCQKDFESIESIRVNHNADVCESENRLKTKQRIDHLSNNIEVLYKSYLYPGTIIKRDIIVTVQTIDHVHFMKCKIYLNIYYIYYIR